ncbi:MAG: hypothetical protein HND58_16320 [Planctomycetota bacterium]|nr:MAG: hypothetical protein HND58_16320 [Planctomycetota bacterium]
MGWPVKDPAIASAPLATCTPIRSKTGFASRPATGPTLANTARTPAGSLRPPGDFAVSAPAKSVPSDAGASSDDATPSASGSDSAVASASAAGLSAVALGSSSGVESAAGRLSGRFRQRGGFGFGFGLGLGLGGFGLRLDRLGRIGVGRGHLSIECFRLGLPSFSFRLGCDLRIRFGLGLRSLGLGRCFRRLRRRWLRWLRDSPGRLAGGLEVLRYPPPSRLPAP